MIEDMELEMKVKESELIQKKVWMRKRKTYCQIRKKGVSMKRKLDKR